MRSRINRLGFTLVELLVVISIIGILVGLLLPAISAPGSGPRAQCQNNMRNLGVGILGYVTANNKFPPLGVISDDPLKMNPGTPPIEVPRNQGIVSWLDPDCTPDAMEVPMYNWVVEILPYIDQQDLASAWTKTGAAMSGTGTIPYSYLSTTIAQKGNPSNYQIGTTSLGVLRCPDDTTAQPGQGNLSYVANAGFSLWTALPLGWTGSSTDGQGKAISYDYSGMRWASPSQGWGGNLLVCRKLGVMFMEDNGPYGPTTMMPWNARTTFPVFLDGTSNTILLSENTLAGAGSPSVYSKNSETNWACPLANFCGFIGSSNICGTNGSCIGGQLQPHRRVSMGRAGNWLIELEPTRTSTTDRTYRLRARSRSPTALILAAVTWFSAMVPCGLSPRPWTARCTQRSSPRPAASWRFTPDSFLSHRMRLPSKRGKRVSGKGQVGVLYGHLPLTVEDSQGLATPMTPTASRPPALPGGCWVFKSSAFTWTTSPRPMIEWVP